VTELSAPSSRTRLGRIDARWLLGLSVAAGWTVLWLDPHQPNALAAIPILLGGLIVLELARRTDLQLRPVLIAIAAVIGMGVMRSPRLSGDLWSYALYGRMVAEYHVSPYTHVPAEFARDPFFFRVAPIWRHTPSVYGPVFVLLASIGALLAGNSAFMNRMFFQLLAVAALIPILWLIWRHTRNPAALAAIGLQPVVTISIVNGAHIDLLVGLAILGATLLVMDSRPGVAGTVVGLGALVKLTGGLAVIGLVPWIWRREGWRAAARFTGGCAVTSNARAISRLSIGNLGRLVTGLDVTGHGWVHEPEPLLRAVISSTALFVTFAVALAIAWRWSRDDSAVESAAGATAAYGFASAYVLPWYAGWWLPVSALTPARRVALFLSGIATLRLALYQLPNGDYASSSWFGAGALLNYAVPAVLLIAFTSCVLWPDRRPVETAPTPSA
jgi:alpha-1,6-mannosyltransferase